MGRTLSSANPGGENRFFGIFDTLSYHHEMQQHYFGIDCCSMFIQPKGKAKAKWWREFILQKRFFLLKLVSLRFAGKYNLFLHKVLDKVVKFSNRKRRRKSYKNVVEKNDVVTRRPYSCIMQFSHKGPVYFLHLNTWVAKKPLEHLCHVLLPPRHFSPCLDSAAVWPHILDRKISPFDSNQVPKSLRKPGRS